MNQESPPGWARIAFIHPIWLTGSLVLAFAISMPLVFADAPTLPAVIGLAVIQCLPQLLAFVWMHAIYRVCSLASGRAGGLRQEWVFWLVYLFLLAIPVGFIGLLTDGEAPRSADGLESLLSILALAVWLRAFWLPMNALQRVENGDRPVPIGQSFWGTVTMLYWPIGAWFLHPRLKKVRARLKP